MTHRCLERRIGGPALIAGPLLVLTGMVLRVPFPFFFPDQLTAAVEHPGLLTAAYTCVLAGTVLLWPAVLTLVARIAVGRPGWAAWGGALVVTGLFERTFHAGFDQAALDLARRRGAGFATAFVGEAYGDLHLFSFLSFTVVFGWLVLAIGAWRAGALGRVQCVALALAAGMPLGVLKGTTVVSLLGAAGLCVALVPFGVKLVFSGPRPAGRTLTLAAATVPALGLLAYVSTLG
ncbi:hypothetical protein [Amycolatopsis sp. NPDC051903]|uniref:hypothetical protein n=1 Tax=Amycolatopsis sp. NPDC051903 TaxID=3363936 RepID=UPI00378CA3C5